MYMPISPMDAVINGIDKRGRELFEQGVIDRPWVGGEIAGRSVRVSDNAIVPVENVDRNVVIHEFQNGARDFMALTEAGSTGVTLSESVRVNDPRGRCMFEHQIARNPVTRVQFWGRIKRRGITMEPEFYCLTSGLPTAIRQLAAQNRKLEQVSALVTGSAEAGISLDTPDLINSLGNDVAFRLLQENPATAYQMAISLKIDEEEAASSLYYVNKMLSRLLLLERAEGDAFYNTFLQNYNDALGVMMSKGMHPTRPREIPGIWTKVSQTIYNPENPSDGHVFGAPVFLSVVEQEVYRYPLDRNDLLVLVAKEKQIHENNAAISRAVLDHLKTNQGNLLKAVLPAKYRSVMAALSARESNMVKITQARIIGISNALNALKAGQDIQISNDNGEPSYAVFLGLKMPSDPKDYDRAGAFGVRYVVPGDEEPRSVTLATLFSDPNYKICPAPDKFEKQYTDFEGLERGKTTVQRMVLDGNAFVATRLAVERNIGKTTRMTYDDGTIASVILIPKSKEALIGLQPSTTTSADVVRAVLQAGGDVFTSISSKSSGMVIKRDGPRIKVVIPGKKTLSKPFEVSAITAVIGKFEGDWRGKEVVIGPEVLDRLVDTMINQGHQIGYDGQYRAIAVEATKAVMQSELENTLSPNYS
jgi:hypothetical protein